MTFYGDCDDCGRYKRLGNRQDHTCADARECKVHRGVIPDTVSHLTAQPVNLVGRFNRQRCAWCGECIVDEDLATMASPSGAVHGTEWPPQRIVRISRGNPSISSLVADTGGKMPEDSCMALFVDAALAEPNVSHAPPVLRVAPDPT